MSCPTAQPATECEDKITPEYFWQKLINVEFNSTVRFLVSRGFPQDAALDTSAQAAWTKGWERREQLRQPSLVVTWTNSIALNIYRTRLRREPQSQPLPELVAPPSLNAVAIDVERSLDKCKRNDPHRIGRPLYCWI